MTLLSVRNTVIATSFAMLVGCVTPGTTWIRGTQDPAYVLVKTNPDGATLTFIDGTTCETPCRIGVVEAIEMTVARAGYRPVRRTINRTTRSPINITLEAVGRRIEVEEVVMPEL